MMGASPLNVLALGCCQKWVNVDMMERRNLGYSDVWRSTSFTIKLTFVTIYSCMTVMSDIRSSDYW